MKTRRVHGVSGDWSGKGLLRAAQGAAVLLAIAIGAPAQVFDLDWHSVDGGGAFLFGGAYQLGGGTGQPDAGPAPAMVGGGFELVGGFWTGRGPCPGDVNGSGSVDLTDLATLLAHFGTAIGATQYTGDLDGDGDVDLNDLSIVLSNFGRLCA